MTPAKPKVDPGIEAVLAMARPREAEVRLCLAGHLAADADRLVAELDHLDKVYKPTSLGDVDPRTELAAELETIRAQMLKAEVVFRFRGLAARPYSDLLAAHPPRDGQNETRWNADTFPPALIAASCIQPTMCTEQAEQLWETADDVTCAELFRAAWRANGSAIEVPTSRVASASRPT